MKNLIEVILTTETVGCTGPQTLNFAPWLFYLELFKRHHGKSTVHRFINCCGARAKLEAW